MADEIITYDIFHDENKEDGFWHSFIFVPRNYKDRLLNLLLEPRINLNYYHPIHFTKIDNKTKSHSEKVRLTKSWVSILYYAIQQQKIEADLYLGHGTHGAILRKIKGPKEKIGAKIVVLREKDCLKKMFPHMSYSKKIETTFRMGLKGGSHFLFNDKVVKIGDIYVDHQKEHFERNYNIDNILTRFKNESKDNILFTEDSTIYPIDKRYYQPKEIISEFMQLADIAVGAVRTRALRIKEPSLRYEITHPLDDLFEKDIRNKARMNNSRFLNSFSLSEAWIEGGSWKFDTMKIQKINLEERPTLF